MRSLRRAPSATDAPAFASVSAVASPIPDEAPVIATAFPLSSAIRRRILALGRYECGLERLGARVGGEGVERAGEVEHAAGDAGRAQQRERAVLAGEDGAGAQQRVEARRVEERELGEVEDERALACPTRRTRPPR